MPSTFERKQRARVTREVSSHLVKSGMTVAKADGWIAHKMGMSPWSVARWRVGETMPTGTRWTAYESIHNQLTKMNKPLSGVQIDKPIATPRATQPGSKRSKARGVTRRRKVLNGKVEPKETPTMHSASVQLITVIVNTMTISELGELHQITGDIILQKARR